VKEDGVKWEARGHKRAGWPQVRKIQ
jgi:hypothetical protein